jgi:hypothetical protein
VFDGPRLLFVPVSGAFGMGEYARSLNLALACTARWPTARIHFIISAQARYASSVPFEHTALPSSPTFHTPQVSEVIARFEPHAVVFDNAGRTAQLVAARRAGARVVYISARPRQRRKAFRWRWMRMLDEHWIAYPQFMAGGLSWTERLKLNWLRRPEVRFLDCILPEATSAGANLVRSRAGVQGERYVLVVPGGGTGHPRAANAVDIFKRAAQVVAARGVHTVFVAPAGALLNGPPHFIGIDLLPLPELLVLLRGAAVVLTNGGDTLIQAIACAIPSVAVPIAADQPGRIARCLQAGVAREATLDAAIMSGAVIELLDRPGAAAELQEQSRRLDLRDGLRESVDALAAMLGRSPKAGLT